MSKLRNFSRQVRAQLTLLIFVALSFNSPAGVVGKWEFNKNLDDSTDNTPARLSGGGSLTFVKDRHGAADNALLLTKRQRINLGEGQRFSFADPTRDKPFTIMWWQNCSIPESRSGRPSSAVFILTKPGEYRLGWSNAFRLQLYDQQGSIGAFGRTRLNTNKWTHIAVIYDGSGSAAGFRFYQDGVRLHMGANITPGYKHMTAGKSPLILGSGFAGAIDDLIIFDRTLSSAEIKQYYQLPAGSQVAGLENADKNILHVELLQPWYMNAVFSDQDLDGFEFEVRLNIASAEQTKYQLKLALQDDAGKTISAQTVPIKPSAKYKLAYPTAKLDFGKYQLSIVAESRKNGTEMAEWKRTIRKLPHRSGQVTFSQNNVCFIDKKLFVPFGLADLGSTPFRIYRCKAAGFNAVHTLWRVTENNLPELDALARAGLKVSVMGFPRLDKIPGSGHKMLVLTDAQKSALSSYIDKYKEHPAILTWYTANEPVPAKFPPEALRELDEIVNQQDPYHPTHIIVNRNDLLKDYYKYANVVGVDPYPIFSTDAPWSESLKVYVLTRPAVTVSDNRKPVWSMLSAFNRNQFAKSPKYRAPDFTDLRCEYYQAIIAGAKGFWWYARYWIEPEVELGLQYLAGENETLKHVIAADPVKDEFAFAGKQTSPVMLSCRKVNNELYVFATNPSFSTQQCAFAAGPEISRLYVAGEARTVTLENGKFTDSFKAYGSHLYTTDASAAKRLDQMRESALKAIKASQNPVPKPGNLVSLDKDIKITISLDLVKVKRGEVFRQPSLKYMIDSNPYSWSTLNNHPGAKLKLPQWVQLDFSGPKTISKVVVDSNINELELQIPEGETWKTLKTSKSGDRSYRDSQVISFAASSVKSLRIVAKSANSIGGLQDNEPIIWEIEAYE
jgi:hypothetical protein